MQIYENIFIHYTFFKICLASLPQASFHTALLTLPLMLLPRPLPVMQFRRPCHSCRSPLLLPLMMTLSCYLSWCPSLRCLSWCPSAATSHDATLCAASHDAPLCAASAAHAHLTFYRLTEGIIIIITIIIVGAIIDAVCPTLSVGGVAGSQCYTGCRVVSCAAPASVSSHSLAWSSTPWWRDNCTLTLESWY